jgi:poly-gamma-glutamate synthesis protein (capsule biosynthesis protein)
VKLALCALLALCAAAFAFPSCPPGQQNYPQFGDDPALFAKAIAKVADFEPSNERLTGIVVPHHLLADRLVALGFRAASAFPYKRIVILTPDHFRRAETLFATSGRGYETELGPVAADQDAVSTLLASEALIEDSCLFDREHGVRALLPFIKHYFPEAKVVPVAMSIRSKRADWDRLIETLLPILDNDTLVVESTDFSHYLPQAIARRFDQQTLNVIAAGNLEQIAALTQPDHADSVGALYVQTALQRRRFGAKPLVVANESSNAFSEKEMPETTSYSVVLFGTFGESFNSPVLDVTRAYYFAGDTNFGRAMKMALLDPDAADRVREAILSRTHGRALIVNLEGVILPNVPEALDDLTLAMPEDLTLRWLNDLNVIAVSLANNHANDLGESGLVETKWALRGAGIRHFGQGEAVSLPGLDIAGLTDLDSTALYQTNLITPAPMERLQPGDGEDSATGRQPLAAMVHWGREYVATPSARELELAEELRLRGVTAIIGAHPHVAGGGPVALAGGETVSVHSLGNFLFDQTAAKASGQLVELRVFPQGTLFLRTIPLPNLFDLARRKQ